MRDRIRDAFDILNHRKLIALVDKSAVRFTCSKFLDSTFFICREVEVRIGS